MYAVIKTGGKQYRVSESDVITVEKLNAEVGSTVEFDKVMLIGDGGDIQAGTPYLDAARVFGSVLENGKGKKAIIFKYKAKKDYRKKQGHRQPYTMVQIDAVSPDGTYTAKKAEPAEEETPAGLDAKAADAAPAMTSQAAAEAETHEDALAAEATAEKKPAAKKKPAKKAADEKQAGESEPDAAAKPAAKKATAKKAAVEEVKTEEE